MPSNLLFALLLFAAWPAHPSSQFATSNSTTYSLTGTVVNSVTNEPIRGALVQIYSGTMLAKLTGPTANSALTDFHPAEQCSRRGNRGFLASKNWAPPALNARA